MGGAGEYLKFFRLRAPACIAGYGVHQGANWLAPALELLDYNEKDFLKEVMAISMVVPGAFTFMDLENLDFDAYEMILEDVKSINDKRKKDAAKR